MLKYLIKHINLFSHFDLCNQLNILNSTVNNSGFTNFKKFKSIKKKDIENSDGIYFLNSSFQTKNLKKLLHLKLLNFFQNNLKTTRFLITQNSTLDTKLTVEFKKNFDFKNQIHLPTTVFFEETGTYINTVGNINKTSKIVTALGQTKSN